MKKKLILGIAIACLVSCDNHVRRQITPTELEGVWIATAASLREAAAADGLFKSPSEGGRVTLRRNGECVYESFLLLAPSKIVWLHGTDTPCRWEIAVEKDGLDAPRPSGSRYLFVTLEYPNSKARFGFELELLEKDRGVILGQPTIDPDHGKSWLLYERNAPLRAS